jgi:type I restriction enzyme S subunit
MTGKFPLVAIGALEDQGAIAEIQDGNHGERHPKVGDYVEDGIPFVMANDLADGLVNLTACSKISQEQALGLRIGFSLVGDVLLTHKGTLGSVALVTEADPFIMLTPQVTYYRTDNSRLLNRFLVYAFREPGFQARMHAVGAQGTRPYIGVTAQRRLQIVFPPYDVQARIANILSAYDDLIENNRRRMALLEEAARQLYREWFVRLRFPGHEHTPISSGVPEGWERLPLGDRVTLNYGKALKAEDRAEGPCPVYGSSGIVGTHEESLAAAPGIVVGRKGNVGSVYWCPKEYWPIDTVYFIDAKASNLWLYYSLQHMHFISTDVAVPGLNRDFAYSRPLLVPDPRIIRDYLEATVPLHEQITKLDEMNEKLSTAGDLLLPRLMSGEIVV